MSKRWKFSVIGLIILLVGVGSMLYGLSPQRHFRSGAPKALAMPQPIPHDWGKSEYVSDDQATEEDNELDEPLARSDESAVPSDQTHTSHTTSIAAAPTPAASTNSKSTHSANSFNVVLIGTDTWGEEGSRADTIMVVHVMPNSRKVNIVSIPRDTRVYVQGVGYTKINHAHSVGEAKGGNHQGTLTLAQAVSDFLNIPVHHYIKTNFAGVSSFIDKIGGIEMYIEQDVTITPEIVIRQGDQHLDGQHALFLARERYSVPGGDFGRQIAQFRIVRAVARQLLKPEHLPDLAALISSGRQDLMDTSFSDSDLISLAWLFKGMDTEDFAYEQIPGKDSSGPDPLVGSDVYYWSADPVQVRSIRERMFNS
ncbi:MAG: hypothetical protein K0R67_10 [Paenibacillus sp.]|nr:hypothetical protein [Paenibacillus sp.]